MRWLEAAALRLEQFQARTRGLSKWLTLLALLYLCLLLALGFRELREIEWAVYLPLLFLSLPIYLASLLCQAIVWLMLILRLRQPSASDLYIFFQSILMRRLPGSIWHWLGRNDYYMRHHQLPAKMVTLASFLEWCLIAITGFLAYGVWSTLPWLARGAIVAATLAALLYIAFSWHSNRPPWVRLSIGLGWSGLLVASWSLGGWIFYLLSAATETSMPVTLQAAQSIWTLAGAISSVTILFPSGLGIQELSLATLNLRFMPLTLTAILAVVLRIIFSIADLLWGFTFSLLLTRFRAD